MMRAAVVVLLILLAGAAPGNAQNVEVRHHFAASDKRIGATYRVTEIFGMPNDTEDRHTFLVEDTVAGDRLLLTQLRDYLKQTGSYEIMDLQTKERVTATVQYPYKSVTRKETIEEMRNLDVSTLTPQITIELSGVSAPVVESEWEGAQGRERRSALRRGATAQFLERMERLRPLLGSRGSLSSFCAALLKFVLYHEACNGPVAFVAAAPDCDFDRAFRYSCSDKQKARVKAAAAEKKILGAY